MNPEPDEWRRKRLDELALKYGGKAALGRALGYRDGAFVRQMIAGERPISEKTIRAVHELPGCEGWFNALIPLLKRMSPEKLGTIATEEPAPTYQATSTITIRQYDAGGRMGASGLVLRDQPGVIRSWDVTPEWLQKNIRNCTSYRNLVIVTGFGDSMRPLYNPGDPLLVDTGVTTVDFDAIYFFRVGEEGFIKRLQRIPGNGLLAISDNERYRDWAITPEMDFEVFGRVIKVWKGDDF